MHCRPDRFPVALLTTLALATGCGAATTAEVNLPPTWRTPDKTKIALVTVDASKQVVERAPSDFANFKAILHGVLAATFGPQFEVVDRTELGFKQVIAPVHPETGKLWIFKDEEAPYLPPNQKYAADAPMGLPVGVVEPMTLGVKVLQWAMNNETVGTGQLARSAPVARLDLVYTLWTKAGKEIETVRVVNSVDGEYNGAALQSFPERTYRLTADYKGDSGESGNRDKTFRAAVANSVAWYAWPMVPHRIKYQAVWHADSDKDKETIKLADAGKWDEAYAAWKAVVDADPKVAPAFFNLGQVCYVQGKHAEAGQHFRRACELDDRLLYRQYRDRVQETENLARPILE